MLEHSPYSQFQANIRKMAIMSRKYVFISLPYYCTGIRIGFEFCFGQQFRKRKNLKVYFPLFGRNRKYRPEYVKEFPWAVHYWEIGRRGYRLKQILMDLRAEGLSILEKFHGDNPYHYFILAEKTRC